MEAHGLQERTVRADSTKCRRVALDAALARTRKLFAGSSVILGFKLSIRAHCLERMSVCSDMGLNFVLQIVYFSFLSPPARTTAVRPRAATK